MPLLIGVMETDIVEKTNENLQNPMKLFKILKYLLTSINLQFIVYFSKSFVGLNISFFQFIYKPDENN